MTDDWSSPKQLFVLLGEKQVGKCLRKKELSSLSEACSTFWPSPTLRNWLRDCLGVLPGSRLALPGSWFMCDFCVDLMVLSLYLHFSSCRLMQHSSGSYSPLAQGMLAIVCKISSMGEEVYYQLSDFKTLQSTTYFLVVVERFIGEKWVNIVLV